MTVFVDDINMPVINEWGDQVRQFVGVVDVTSHIMFIVRTVQITNEIVRQLMAMKGFYSLEKPGDFTNIVDIQFLAATIHPGGGRNDIPPRLKRQFVVLNCTLPSNASIDKVFSVIGCGYFCAERGFGGDIVSRVLDIVKATRKLWQATKVKMLPTPAKFHYVFNLRDLSRIWEGMLHVDKETVTSFELFLSLWKHECIRVIADRFTNAPDKEWFDKAITRTILEDLGEDIVKLIPEEPYFVDFLRDPPEATGDEPDDVELEAPKIYEPVRY